MPAISLQPSRCYQPSFHFDLSKRCYCGAPKRFGECCANRLIRAIPRGIEIAEGFLSPSECKRFIRYAQKQKRNWLEVIRTDENGNTKRFIDRARVTQRVSLGKRQNEATQWMKNACDQMIVEKCGRSVEWIESPQVLRYGVEGKYNLHSDSENFDSTTKQFYRFIDRDFSMLIYLNDDYKGGELNFPWLNYAYRPRQGDLVIFPSNHVFSHESLPIVAGNKYALVSWGAYRDTLRVSAPRNKISMIQEQLVH